MNYTHLTQDERYQIAVLRKAGHTQGQIAKLLDRHSATIGREVRRNIGLRGYRPKQAQASYKERLKACQNGPRISQSTWDRVDEKLALTWSPEQIAGYLAVNKAPTVSHEAIYRRIYADKRAGGHLHLALRCQKPRKKRHTGRERRGSITGQVSIELRPECVNQRERFGDWEADLVIGAGHKQALVTINERVSRFSLIAHVPSKTAAHVTAAITTLLKPFAHCVHTLTTDNGKEFAMHAVSSKALQSQHYFAHPYRSWERGANENMNGLIREFFPKKMAFSHISEADIVRATHLLNHRPRKCLNYKTPHDVFMAKLHSHDPGVALRG
jgi:IS30 family transposase